MIQKPLSWFGIARLGLVQASLGAVVALTNSTFNRVMVVELELAAMIPAFLVGLHYAVQLSRPRMGHGSDVGRARTPWIIGGMLVLALGGVGAAAAIALMATEFALGLVAGILAFVLIGAGVGASGTCLLVLLATRVSETRRPAAATITWIMMIAGIVITATTAGSFLDPFGMERLIVVTATVGGLALVLTTLALLGIEGKTAVGVPQSEDEHPRFIEALSQVAAEPQARAFALFVFVSMLAYSSQDLILEPFAGLVFGLTPGESTKLSGTQHGGVLLGMILIGLVGSLQARRSVRRRAADIGEATSGDDVGNRLGQMRHWVTGGCVASAASLTALTIGGMVGPSWPLQANVFLLGFSNGAFAVAAIAAMMALVGAGRKRREGVRMGLFGAAQAIAFGVGGFMGAAAVDAMRMLTSSPEIAYGTVFVCEGLLFLLAAGLALRVPRTAKAALASKNDGVSDAGFPNSGAPLAAGLSQR